MTFTLLIVIILVYTVVYITLTNYIKIRALTKVVRAQTCLLDDLVSALRSLGEVHNDTVDVVLEYIQEHDPEYYRNVVEKEVNTHADNTDSDSGIAGKCTDTDQHTHSSASPC